MAVAKKPLGVREFKQSYRLRNLSILIGLALFFSLIQTGLVILVADIELICQQSIIVLAVSLALNISVVYASYFLLKRPLDKLLAAIVYKAGDPTITTPPNPNSKYNEKTGLKGIIQFIYDCSRESDSGAKSPKQDLLSAALNNTSCGVVIYDQDGKIISANKAAPLGYTTNGDPFLALNFVGESDILEWASSNEDQAISAEKRWSRIGVDSNIIKKPRFYDIVASYEKGAQAEIVVILIDKSDRYLPEEEDLNFIAFAAHELRGPITVIRGYLDILEQELADRLQQDEPELINRLSVSASRLSSYVNNILNVAKYDRHHLQVHLYEDTVAAIYATIADDMMMRAQTQRRMINVNIPTDLPTIAADRGSISEALGNMIDNAIKYSFDGGVVSVSAAAKGEFVEVSIQDNGIGMPANVVSNLFRKFYRSHRSRESVAGTGIGLYITKAFIESHGGSISVISKENEGSTFSFTLPIYSTVSDKLLEDGQLNQALIRKDGGWIKNHAMYRR